MDKPLLHDENPIAVVWDNNLTDKDKLVFGEIFTMINQGKPFIMSNKKLAIRLNCTSRTISKSVSHLVKTNWIKTRSIKSKNGATEFREVYGINLLRAMKFSSRVHRNISLDGHEINFHQIDHTNTSINKSVTDNSNAKIRRWIGNQLQQLGVININSFIWDDIDDWVDNYSSKMIKTAIKQVAETNPSPTWVVKDVNGQLNRGCKTYQPKRRNNYGRRPIKRKLPTWARSDYHQNLHPTSKKDQLKIKKQLKELNHRGDKK